MEEFSVGARDHGQALAQTGEQGPVHMKLAVRTKIEVAMRANRNFRVTDSHNRPLSKEIAGSARDGSAAKGREAAPLSYLL